MMEGVQPSKRSGKSKQKKKCKKEDETEALSSGVPQAPVLEEFETLDFTEDEEVCDIEFTLIEPEPNLTKTETPRIIDELNKFKEPTSSEIPLEIGDPIAIKEELNQTETEEATEIDQIKIEKSLITPSCPPVVEKKDQPDVQVEHCEEVLKIEKSLITPSCPAVVEEKDQPDVQIEHCEEVLTVNEVCPTAPQNLESGDFFSLQATRSLEKVEILAEVKEATEFQPQEQFQFRTRSFPQSQIKSLYNNYLLENNEEFVRQFLGSVQLSYDGFELYELMSNYFRACNQLTGCEKSLSSLKDSCDDYEKLVWTLSPETLTQSTQCDDGNTVDATYKIHISKFNQEVFSNLNRTLKDIKELLKEPFSLSTYSVELRKSQIDHFFYKCFNHFNLESFQVQSSVGYPTQDARSCANLLKKCISTIFIFIRKPLPQSRFAQDCQKWVQKCAGLLLRIATIEDHLFLLNHVIRCPPKIVSKWAAALIQIPPIPLQVNDYSTSFGHLHLDYALTVLACILREVPKREEFLNQQIVGDKRPLNPVDASLQWVVVDSDGEDDPEDSSFFKESDLISLLHQIPFDCIFRRILLVYQSTEGDTYDIRFCSDHSILKLLAFSSQLVDVMGCGFTTYYTDRYRQLVKLLGRLILHTVQYVTEQVHNFATVNGSTSTVESILPDEYDIFLLSAVEMLISAKSIGTLQFLAAIPYHLVSTGMLWELYSKVTKWDSFEESKRNSKMEVISSDFENELLAGSESNAFYLLTTMSNMAVARDGRDSDFIRIVTLHLFQIGFLNPATRDSCSKTARDLLSNLTQNYPHLISILIQSMKSQIDVMEKMSLFLLRELSFELWKPVESDVQLLSNWLLNFQPYSLENQIGRFVIQSMNWDFDDNGLVFLPYTLHCKIALLVAEAQTKWETNLGVITESVKQMSAWVTKIADFSTWAWEIIKRLHLHGLDRSNVGEFSITKILRNLPSFDSHNDLEPLKRSVDLKNPLSCMVALLMTPLGHSLPLLCSDGFNLIDVLLQNSNFDAVINVLYFITPLFAASRDALITNEKFKTFICQILAADMTYVKMAKNMISLEFPGHHTKLFGNMIQAQFDQCSRFGTSEGKILRIWTEILTKIENWNKDNNILYLLDILARFAFTRLEHKTFFHSYFSAIYKDLPKGNSAGITSFLFNWSPSATTLLTNPSYAQMPYFVYFILSIEKEMENQSGFWNSLIQSLMNPKTSVENAVKKASSSSKFATNSTYLSIYRWSQQSLDLPVDHPILFLSWQKFFQRYLHRVITINHRDGVGERFFEGLINSAFLKKIKKRLHEILEYYQHTLDRLETNDETNYDAGLPENTALITNYLRICLQIIKAMTLWIEDPQFHHDSLYIPALPLQCLPDRLLSLVEGDDRDWTNCIDFEAINTAELKSSRDYLTSINRLCWKEPIKFNRSTTRVVGQLSRHEEFMKRLNSYDQPIGPPAVPVFHQILPPASPTMYIDKSVMCSNVKFHFDELIDFAQLFSLQISQHTNLDCSYCESLPELYFNVDSEALVNVNCSSGKKFKGCTGAGHVIFKFTEARLNERIGHMIHQNRTEYHSLISQKCVQPPPSQLCVAAVFLEDFITNLITRHRSDATTIDSEIVQAVGIELFYSILELINEETNFYPPTRQLLSSFVEVLGHEFVSTQPTECKRLVQTCIRNPFLVGALAPHMNLVNAEATPLTEIYGDIVGIPKKDADLAFVILTKLDLWSWLKKAKPKLSDRSHLISLIWKALTSEGFNSERTSHMAYETYRNHLKIMVMFDFPQHYGEILNYLLEGSEKQLVLVDIWYDFFNALNRDRIRLRKGMDPFARKRELKQVATETNFLEFRELQETAQLLSSHFTKERLSYGIYGLYPKYRMYIEPLSCFLQLVSYTVIAAYVKHSMGSASQKIIVEVWPILRDIYTPWILPYNQKVIRKQCAQWIQQMNFDDTSVLQPWTPNDAHFGMIFMSDFTDCILFLAETLPGSSALCSHLWNFYEESYAQVNAKDHVLANVHNCFISIPWSMFWPSLADLENMNKIVEKYLPACHNFIGVVFPQINWQEWVNQCIHRNSGHTTHINRSHSLLLNLTIRLANEIVARESPTWITVMEIINRLNWNYITSNSLESVLNWFVMSIDPRVILSMDCTHRMDMASFILLKIASGYMVVPQHAEIGNEKPCSSTQILSRKTSSCTTSGESNRKRYLFIRTCVRLIISTSTKYKNLLSSHPKSFELAIHNLLDDMVVIIRNEAQVKEDFSAHLKELITLMSNHYLGTITRNAFIGWCEKNSNAPLPMLFGIIQLSFGAKVQPYTAVPLIETAISLAFKHEETTWENICNLTCVSPEQSESSQYFEVASKDGHYLVLYSLLLKRFPSFCHSGLTTVSFLTDLLKNLKPRETNEAVLPLIYQVLLNINIQLLNEDNQLPGRNLQKSVKKFLLTFVTHLAAVGDDKQGWGLLGAFGLGRSSPLTVRGRLFARCLSVFLLAQLPLNAPIRISPESVGHFTAEYSSTKPHGEMQSNLDRLDGLKLNRLYGDVFECIDSAFAIIKNPSYSISRHDEIISELTSHLFSEPYLKDIK